MVEITFDLDTSPIGKLPAKWDKARKQGLFYNAQDMTRFLIQNSPVDHGLLRQWFISDLTDEQATIKSPAEYAIYQDQGTRPHMIYPKGLATYHAGRKLTSGSALWWPGADHPVRAVHHPGIKAKHFVDRSFNQLQPLVLGNFMKALEEQQ